MLASHQVAVRHSVSMVAAIRDDQWSAPTPCAGWDVRALVDHMTSDNRGFAAAARGERTDVTPWDSVPTEDPRADFAASADEVIAAFAALDLDADTFWLPRVDEHRLFPARQAVSFHLLDYVVHAWDVAVSCDIPLALEPSLVALTLDIAYREVPNCPRRLRRGAGFRPALPEPDSDHPMDRLLALLGRASKFGAAVAT